MPDTTDMMPETCINCGITFFLPKVYQAELKRTHRSFYCPNGHSQFYPGKTENEKLNELLQEKNREIMSLNQSLMSWKEEVNFLKETKSKKKVKK